MKRLRVLMLRWYEILAAVLILLVFYLWLTSLPSWNPSVGRMVQTTKWAVSTVKSQIVKFKEINGRYPNSLAELQQYSKENPNVGLGNVPVTERISDPSGNSNEFDVLNNQGGWYYNKNTGEVKINLTEPVNHYVESYVGSIGKETPADW